MVLRSRCAKKLENRYIENRSTHCEILSISYAVSIVVLPADTAAVNRRGDPPVVNTSLSYLVRKV